MQPGRLHPPLKMSSRWAWEPLTKCRSTPEGAEFLSNWLSGATVALDGKGGVNGQWWGSWGVSAGWSCLLRKVDCRNESNGGTWHVVVDWGHGTNDGLHGGNPLQMANRLDGVNWHGVCRFVSRAVGYGFSIRSHFRSEVDVLCCQDRWNFSWEIFYNSSSVLIHVEGSGLRAMEKGESTLVTKMGTCYWRDGGTGVCYDLCTWNPTQSLRNPAQPLAQPHGVVGEKEKEV